MNPKMLSARAMVVVGAAMLAFLAAPPALAMDSCSGSYAATLLHPLSKPLVVGLVLRDDSPRNIELAGRFKAGLQRAGIAVVGRPTMQLTLRVTITGRDAADDAPTAPRSDFGFAWGGGGGTDPQLPGESRFGGSRAAPGPVTLQLRAELRRSPADPVAWVGTLQCAVQGDDDRQLAYDIGTVIGRGIGRRVERKAF